MRHRRRRAARAIARASRRVRGAAFVALSVACVAPAPAAFAALPPAQAPLVSERPAALLRETPVLSWRMLDAAPALPPRAAPFSEAAAARVICVAAADCYAGDWPARVAARAEQAATRAERVAPLSVLAAAPFALFSVAAIAWGLARGERLRASWFRRAG